MSSDLIMDFRSLAKLISKIENNRAGYEDDLMSLYKENSVLKSKMRILVEKLEEYRRQEATMQSAILAAQKTCEQMTLEAEKKCAKMLRD